MKINFYLKKSEPTKAGIPILLTVSWPGHRLRYNTRLHAQPGRWDERKQRLKVMMDPACIAVNNELVALEKLIISQADKINSAAQLKKYLDDELGRSKKNTTTQDIDLQHFISFIDLYLAERRASPAYQRGTDKVLLTCRNHLQTICPQTRMSDINWHWRKQLEYQLYKLDLSINYVAKMLEVVRQFIREAVRRELIKTSVHQDKSWSVKKTPVKNFYYTMDELATLYHTPVTGMDERVRDLFLIGAYSGLRFSDFSRIRPEHVTGDTLTIRMQKTGQEVVIPLHPVLRALLEKYEYKVRGMANQVFNRHIKEVCRLAGFNNKVVQVTTASGRVVESVREKWEITSSHTARRSFATNFYQLGVPAMYIMKITGHKTERQFMQYICLDGEDNARAMAKIIAEKMNFKLKAI